jgi:aspartyl protease family protein
MSGQGFAIAAALTVGVFVFAESREGASDPVSPKPKQASLPADDEADGSDAIGNGLASVTIERASDNHFYADARVNGTNVRFLIDTGSSTVALTRADALRAGMGAGDFDATGIGAGGKVKLMPTTIGRLSIGPLSADNVPAVVAEDGLPVSLLGQSYLSRLGSVSISGDRMTLR